MKAMAATDSKSDVDRSASYMLTTYDNPFDPFTQWDDWFAWDEAAQYHTCGLLDRIALTSDEMSELDQHLALQKAIDEIVRENVSGMHRRVLKGQLVKLQAQHDQDVQSLS